MPPLSLMIKPVSGLCNMRCGYCFYADEMANREIAIYPKMSFETLEILVRRAVSYAEGSVSFAFQGGEPTLAGAEFYEHLIFLQKKYNTRGLKVSNSVQTNGYQLDDRLLDLFAREKFLLGVSVDGDRAENDKMRVNAAGEGTFDRVMGNIEKLKARGIEYNLLCVVNHYVARRPKQVFDALRDSGFIQFIPCLDDLDGETHDHSLTQEDFLTFLKETFDLYHQAFSRGETISVRAFDNYVGALMGREMESCAMRGICGNYYLIEADGGVYPCDFYVLDEWRLGNIVHESFYKLEKSELVMAFRARSAALPQKCQRCDWFFLCRDGCPRERNSEGVNRFCEAYQSFFEYAYPRMRAMADRFARG